MVRHNTGSLQGDANHDNWIFCLATLLSSMLCYNAKGTIDDDALKKLKYPFDITDILFLLYLDMRQ